MRLIKRLSIIRFYFVLDLLLRSTCFPFYLRSFRQRRRTSFTLIGDVPIVTHVGMIQ
jgi:hypothetical protein